MGGAGGHTTAERGEALLAIEDLAVSYLTHRGPVRAVRGVSLTIHRGEAYGLVGESGCGKSTLALAVMRYLGPNGRIEAGRVRFRGEDLLARSPAELRAVRGARIAMVYQDPLAALNPTMRIGEQLAEVLTVHRGLSRTEARQRCLAMLRTVHLADPEVVLERYPHQLSGGQQQRVLIAMALLPNPDLLILDEPTTGLDVTVEAAVLDLIAELRRGLATAILYISHNLGVIARICDRVGVMYAGEVVEEAGVEDIFLHPLHPYTRNLLRCVPRMDAPEGRDLHPILGHLPSPEALPPGCAFEPRCAFARAVCRQGRPELAEAFPGRAVRCIRWREVETARDAGQAAPAALERPGREPAASPLLSARALRAYYREEASALSALLPGRRRAVKAVDGVSLDVRPGETLGIVGESGCGKSTLAKCVAGLVAVSGGTLTFRGADIARRVEQREPAVLRAIRMVFQNPDATLNPSHTVGYALARPLRRLGGVPRGQVDHEVRRLLRSVQLDEGLADRYPEQLSGGQKQRVAIARAFAGRPALVLCDEPVSALDVSVQASILQQLREVQRAHGTALLFISHDLSVVRSLCETIAVMYLGQFCEVGRAAEVFSPPYHPYTEALLSAVPVPDPRARRERIRLEGPVPSALDPPVGCRFHTRCPRKVGPICETTPPPEHTVSAEHRISCHIPLAELRRTPPVVRVGRA